MISKFTHIEIICYIFCTERSRFMYAPKKVIVRGLGIVKPQKQLDNLIEWLGIINQGGRIMNLNIL